MAEICSKEEIKKLLDGYPSAYVDTAKRLWKQYDDERKKLIKAESATFTGDLGVVYLSTHDAAVGCLAFFNKRLGDFAVETKTFLPEKVNGLKKKWITERDAAKSGKDDLLAKFQVHLMFNAEAFANMVGTYKNDFVPRISKLKSDAEAYRGVSANNFDSTVLAGKDGAGFVKNAVDLAKEYKILQSKTSTDLADTVSRRPPKGALSADIKLRADAIIFFENRLSDINKFSFIEPAAAMLPKMRLEELRDIDTALDDIEKFVTLCKVLIDKSSIRIANEIIKLETDFDRIDFERDYPNATPNPGQDFGVDATKIHKLMNEARRIFDDTYANYTKLTIEIQAIEKKLKSLKLIKIKDAKFVQTLKDAEFEQAKCAAISVALAAKMKAASTTLGDFMKIATVRQKQYRALA